MNNVVDYLCDKWCWSEAIAKAAVEFKGCCAYCDEDLLDTRLGYSSISLDHLLPKANYPDLVGYSLNHILSCASCNWMKGSLNVIDSGEDPKQMLDNNRYELIVRVRKKLVDKIKARESEWQSIRNAIHKGKSH